MYIVDILLVQYYYPLAAPTNDNSTEKSGSDGVHNGLNLKGAYPMESDVQTRKSGKRVRG